jgi:hypothetical protein
VNVVATPQSLASQAWDPTNVWTHIGSTGYVLLNTPIPRAFDYRSGERRTFWCGVRLQPARPRAARACVCVCGRLRCPPLQPAQSR